MYLLENPVLQRELLVNLRMSRAFVLLLAYQVLLGAVVYFAWPQETRLDLTTNPEAARRLVNLFFLGQYIIASLMAPSFAAGTISGEKERKTYEMLLASPLRPSAIVLGKLLASLMHLGILIFASLPIVMLCLPLGGVSFWEVLGAYFALILSVTAFGMISIACSSFFQRTAGSLVVSYLLILPMALVGVLLWVALESIGELRLVLTFVALPIMFAALVTILFALTSARMLHPPDVGSEGKEVVDIEEENKQAVGLVIQRDQFPDRLFAPPKRNDFLDEGANPVYDKEIRSEIFSQGTLMMRVVIQVSMFMAIPLMAICLYIASQYAPWYIAYVVMFNMLVGPVFSAGVVTSERERQTLDLLLCTMITPLQILWGKLIAGLRISSVLTSFLLFPVLLASAMHPTYWRNPLAVLAYISIVVMTCLTTSTVALFCSTCFSKTSMAQMTAYLVIVALFCVPLATGYFADLFLVDQTDGDALAVIEQQREMADAGTAEYTQEGLAEALTAAQLSNRRGRKSWTPEDVTELVNRSQTVKGIRTLGVTSPFSAAFSIPLHVESAGETINQGDTWLLYFGYMGFSTLLVCTLLGLMIWMFHTRWRVAE